MGFHKRHVSKDLILSYYKNSGLDGVKLVFKADALFIGDEFSSDIHNLLIEGNMLEITNKIKKEINETL